MLIHHIMGEKMIERYTRPEMGRIWTLENKYRKWLDVELAVCEVLYQRGKIPPEDYKAISEKAGFNVKRIDEIERETQHDVIAFLTSVAESVGPSARFIHEGLTSSDVLDTAFGLLLTEASDLLVEDVDNLLGVLKRRAFEFKDTVQIGRSHNVHAEPITFGLKLAVWYSEMERNRDRLAAEPGRRYVLEKYPVLSERSQTSTPKSRKRFACGLAFNRLRSARR